MKQFELQLLRADFLPEYLSALPVDLSLAIKNLDIKGGYSADDFANHVQRAAAFPAGSRLAIAYLGLTILSAVPTTPVAF